MLQRGQVYFCPWILIPANYDGRAISVEKEDCGILGSGLKKVVFDRQVQRWGEGAGDVDLGVALEGLGEGRREAMGAWAYWPFSRSKKKESKAPGGCHSLDRGIDSDRVCCELIQA